MLVPEPTGVCKVWGRDTIIFRSDISMYWVSVIHRCISKVMQVLVW